MKTHKVRPVLVESQNRTDLIVCAVDNHLHKTEYYRNAYESPYGKDEYVELILISLEDEEIKVGEIGLDLRDNTLFEVKRILTNHYESGILSFQKSYCKKVTTRQSQIPLEYISKFIEQYNKGCVEDLEIKCGGSYEEFLDFCGKLGYDYDGAFGWYKRIDPGGNRPNTSTLEDLFNKYPKLTNGFVTIVEKPIYQQIIDIVGGEEAFCKLAGIKKEPISYTKEDVYNFLKETISLFIWYKSRSKL